MLINRYFFKSFYMPRNSFLFIGNCSPLLHTFDRLKNDDGHACLIDIVLLLRLCSAFRYEHI